MIMDDICVQKINLEVDLLRSYLTHDPVDTISKSKGSDQDYCDAIDVTSSVCQGKYKQILERTWSIDLLATSGEATHQQDIHSYLTQRIKQFAKGPDSVQYYRSVQVLTLAITYLQIFVQNNWLGPPTELPRIGIFQQTENQDGAIPSYITDSLCVDGDVFLQSVRHPEYLFLAKNILTIAKDHLKECLTTDWWLLRCCQIHQAVLNERSPTLKALSIELIQSVSQNEELMAKDEYRDLAIQFHMEAGHLCYFFYEPSQAKEHFNQAEKVSGLDISLTGELGKRTRFQQKEISQLVLKVTHNDSKQLWSPPDGDTHPLLPQNVSLNDDTVLETIKLSHTDKTLLEPVSAVQQALILGLCYRHRRSSEGQGKIIEEECLAFINGALEKPRSWCVMTTALLMRAQWECDSMRRMQRSLAQLEELVAQYRRPEPGPETRLPLIYSVRLPPIWEIQCQLAALLEKIGAMNAALEVYLSIEAWEEVIRCYAHLGKKTKADKLIREQLAVRESPLLWCYLGDIHDDEQYYHKAWEISNGRFARAQRSLALLYLHKKQYEEALPHFEMSLKVNTLQIGVWFSYGCCALSCHKYDVAALAFRRCLTLESDNYEAWSNLATAYIRSNQKSRAFTVLQEAIKCEFENWRLWENYLVLSVDVGQFEESIQAYHRMLDLKDKYTDIQVLEVLARAIKDNLNDAYDKPAARLRPKALELFGRITSKITGSGDIWRLYAEVVMSAAGSQTDADTHNMVTQTDMEKAVQYLQKAHRCATQTRNWEKDVNKCKDIILQSIHLAKAYLECTSRMENQSQTSQMLGSARLMIKGVLTSVKNHQVDVITNELAADIRDLYPQLEEQLTLVTDTIKQYQS